MIQINYSTYTYSKMFLAGRAYIFLVLVLLLYCLTGLNKTYGQSCRIDILVAYTHEAAVEATGDTAIITDIEDAVNQTDLSFTDSGVDARISLVRTIKLNETASQCIVTNLNELQNDSDGVADIVHTLRERYHADLVIFVVNTIDDERCGISYSPENEVASDTDAFAVVQYDCMRYNLSLARQIGSMHGCGYEIRGSGGGPMHTVTAG